MQRHLPDWSFALWDDDDNSELMARYFPEQVGVYERIKLGVMKSDIARLALLYAHGGFYVDTDYFMYRPIPDEIRRHPCILPVEQASDWSERSFRIGNAALGAEAGHPFLADFVKHACEVASRDDPEEQKSVVGVAGPYAITMYLHANRHRYQRVYYPPRSVFFPQRNGRGPDTIGKHLCWGSWRSKPLRAGLRTALRRKLEGAVALWS
ncbi:glycosyltransferase family 32 protein [Flaviflagellibacter deserti]|uniref:Glycosyltransferase family 32 protein n=1 Tax=Flaviflagellibacter deserti TaxID=2267266 RepID=A0ABV9Z187_9HYPH